MTASTIIRPGDFTDARDNGTLWGAGGMRHLITALAGTLVIAVTDRQTGHTQMGVTLVEVADTGRGIQVLIDYGSHRTWTSLDHMGEIIPLNPDVNAYDRAHQAERDEHLAAIAHVRENHLTDEDRYKGVIKATSRCHDTTVTHTPDPKRRYRSSTWVMSLDRADSHKLLPY